MSGSNKPDKEPYLLTNILEYNNGFVLNNKLKEKYTDKDLIKLLSINNFNTEDNNECICDILDSSIIETYNKKIEGKKKNYVKKTKKVGFKNTTIMEKLDIIKNCLKDQKKFNSLLSSLISEMKIDDKLDKKELSDDPESKSKDSKFQESEKNSKEKESTQEEVTVDAGVPDIDQPQNETNENTEILETKDTLDSNSKRKNQIKNLNDQKYKRKLYGVCFSSLGC